MLEQKIGIGSFMGGMGTIEAGLIRNFGTNSVNMLYNIDKDSQLATKNGNGCMLVYNHHFGTNFNSRDILTTQPKDLLGNLDILVISFPSNTFNNKGTHKAYDGTGKILYSKMGNVPRYSNITFAALDLAISKNPSIIIIDNTEYTEQYKTFIRKFEKHNYESLTTIYNVCYFNAPQDRERTCTILFKKGIIDISNFQFPQGSLTPATFERCLERYSTNDDKWLNDTEVENLLRKLKEKYNKRKANKDNQLTLYYPESSLYKSDCSNLVDIDKLIGVNGGASGIIFSKEDLPQLCKTITASYNYQRGWPIYIYENGRIRLLTALEIFRLMGFTDGFYYEVSKLNLGYKQLVSLVGNAVVGQFYNELAKQLCRLPEFQNRLSLLNKVA